MNRFIGELAGGALAALVLVAGPLRAQDGQLQPRRLCDMNSDLESGLLIGGVGGAYLLASPGPLVIDVYRVDLNPDDGLTPLRAVLFAPDRTVLDEQWLHAGPEAPGGAGDWPVLRFETTVRHKGVFGLNVTLTGDRYGQRAHWGFRTNCPLYLIETSRGHRDARHQEPIVLNNPRIDGNVCFMPRAAAIELEAEGVPAAAGPLRLYDSEGALLQTLPVSDKGVAKGKIPADVPRGRGPWRLHLPVFKGVVQIDGVTRWERDDTYANLSMWSPDPASWFNYFDYRWLLTPYQRTVYGEPGQSRSLSFEVHNHGREEIEVLLALEGDGVQAAEASLSTPVLKLAARQSESVPVDIRFPAAGDQRQIRLRATPADDPEMSTYSTLLPRVGSAPAQRGISMPIVLEPYRHENRQFGYLPEYPTGNQVYFDSENRAYVLANSHLHVQRDGAWQRIPLSRALQDSNDSVRQRITKIAFDDRDTLYTIGSGRGQALLVYSKDGGQTLNSVPIPGGGSFDIEQFSGHNVPSYPPPLVRFKRTARDPKLKWRSLNDLDLFLPVRDGDSILMGDPISLSRTCIGLSAHSGIPSSVVSRGNRVHVAWGEATDPAENVPGVPTYVATFERGEGLLGEPALVGYGPPANDVHNSPCITIDSKGVLHVLVGTHGRTFKYARSRQPNTAHEGWTDPADVGPGLRQTYVGLVCDQQDNLHLVFRLWQSAGDYFPGGSYAQLAHMIKPVGAPWSSPRPLVVAPFTEYSIYYHRLTVDRGGRLFLSYDYWSTFWFYRTDHRGDRRALIMSEDSAATWRFAANEDLRP